VVSEKLSPAEEVAANIGRSGLLDLRNRMERRWLNTVHWDLSYSQHKNYEIFKNFFVFSGAYIYGTTGDYPVTRAELAIVMPDQGAAQAMLNIVNDMSNASAKNQQQALELGRKFILDWVK
jgi:hypothetical protein